jgi:membrane fusion protein, adhesin transport system
MRKGERPPRLATWVVGSICSLLFALISWAAWARLEEVTRGSGRVIPSSRIQVVQSSEPGVIREIAIRLGQRVSRGDLLVRLDDTPSSSKAGEVEAQVRTLRAQIARLEVEQAGKMGFSCPGDLAETAPGVCESEARLLGIRRDNQVKRLEGLEQKIEQRRRELNETNATLARLEEGHKLAAKELAILSPMAGRNLVSQTELLRAQRQEVEARGQIATLRETAARLQSALKEAKLQAEEQLLAFQQEAIAELTVRRSELSVAQETFRGAEDRLRRTDIRSPVDGIVNSLPLTTIGAFVNAGDRVAEIVPVEDKLLVEAKVRPADIAFISPGQRALVKITAYDFSQYGGLSGVVEQISADSLFDPNEKEAFYSVTVRTEEASLSVGQKTLPIIPGMMCDVDIITGEKSILNYLLKPINRARQEALRER